MRLITGVLAFAGAGVLLLPAQSLRAQTIDPSGHYEGDVSSPAGTTSLQIDLTKTSTGEMAGTLTVPAQKLTGFPMTNVIVKGADVSFDIATSGGGYFRGELTAHEISGEFSTAIGAVPLVLERAGDAHTYPLPTSARISKAVEGVWHGTLEVDGGMRVTLRLANQSDGTSRGEFVSVDENNLTVPVAVTESGSTLTVGLPMIGGSYTGTVNADGTMVSGIYTTSRGLALPLALKRATTN